ncbi:MAG: 50S ribosomal protein L19 [Chlamydiae bacterium]|nr:50S ribosomal protein L19 [Chlamydiota bacterium]
MSKSAIIQKLEQGNLKKDIPNFKVGDTVRVHIRIIEGSKERTQVFLGTVIARKGTGLSETFSVHRVAYGEGMERIFLLHSPRVSKIEIVKRGRVRRAKLYYLRGTKGKKAKVKGNLAATLKDVSERKRLSKEKQAAKEEEVVAEAPVEEDVAPEAPEES